MFKNKPAIKNVESLLASVFDFFFVIDRTNKIIEICGKLLNYEMEDLVGTPLANFFNETPIDNWPKDFVDFFLEKDFFQAEVTIAPPDGASIGLQVCIAATDKEGQFLVMCKYKNATSTSSELKYHRVFESSSEAILLIDNKNNAEYNLATEKLFRCSTPNDRLKCQQCVQTFVNELVDKIVERAQVQSYKFSTKLKKAGGEFVAEVFSIPFFIDGKVYLQTSLFDVTERNELENELVTEQKRWQRMMEILPGGVFVADSRGNNHYGNNNLYPMTGFSNIHGEDLGNSWLDSIHPEDRQMVEREWQIMVDGKRDFNCIYRYIFNEKENWVHGIASFLKEERGMQFFLGSLQDVSEVVNANEKLEHILRNISEIIYVLDKEATFLEIYESEKERLNLAKEDLIGKSIAVLYDHEFLQQMKHHIQGALFTDRVFTFEYDQVIDGYLKYFQARISKLTESTVVVSVRNITHEKEVLNELESERIRSIEASKLATLGEMSAGIAHEINNPLAVISGKMQRLRTLHESGRLTDEKLVETIDKSELTVKRISRIVTGLRTFARDGSKDPFEKVTVKSIVEDTVALCQEKFKNHAVKLVIDKFRPDLEVEAVNIQISQVVLNLLSNAYDAIEERPGEKWIKLMVKEDIETVTISVMDCGDGIPDEIAKKILQPFFTTKPVGKGTGLGLSISKSIIENHSGIFRIDDSCENTKFDIVLPKDQEKNLINKNTVVNKIDSA